MIIAHRGYCKSESENTINAFDAAIKASADAIETDVRLTQDEEVVVSHDDIIKLKNQLTTISSTSLYTLKQLRASEPSQLILLDELFEYIKQKNVVFFLELKSSSPVLLAKVIKKINDLDVWDKVHIIGFSENTTSALASQKYFPRLLVDQILRFPMWSYIQKPQTSNALYLGWLDDYMNSERIFKNTITQERLVKFKDYFESKGFKIFGGVLNNKEGIDYFHKAGINDIFTDEVEKAVLCHKQQ